MKKKGGKSIFGRTYHVSGKKTTLNTAFGLITLGGGSDVAKKAVRKILGKKRGRSKK